jgi:hypothetical protein
MGTAGLTGAKFERVNKVIKSLMGRHCISIAK